MQYLVEPYSSGGSGECSCFVNIQGKCGTNCAGYCSTNCSVRRDPCPSHCYSKACSPHANPYGTIISK